MVWATLLGFLLWGELPDLVSIAGILVIIGSGLYIIAREQRHRQQA
jgi:drug/metabolite transporter (DMT)-like permease